MEAGEGLMDGEEMRRVVEDGVLEVGMVGKAGMEVGLVPMEVMEGAIGMEMEQGEKVTVRKAAEEMKEETCEMETEEMEVAMTLVEE